MRRQKPSWPLTASLALAAAAGAAAADPKPFEEILPESTSVFVSVRSLPDVLQWWETSSITGLVKDPEMQPFLKKAAESFDVLMSEMRKQAGFTLADLKEACTGEIAFALGDPAEILALEEKGGDGPLILLVEARGTRDKVRDILKRGLEKVERRRREIDFRGQAIIVLEPREEERKAKEPAVYIAHAEDILAVSLSRGLLQDALANRADAAVKPLSEAADFKELCAKHGRDAAIFGYANTGRWIDKLPGLLPDAELPPEQLRRVFEILGLSRIRAVSLAQTLSPDGVKATYYVHAPSGPGGLLAFVWTKPRALDFPSIIPEDATTAWVAQVDFGALTKTIEDAVRAFAPGGEAGEGEDPIRTMEAALGLSLKDDIIGPLGGQISYFQRSGKSAGIPDFAVLAEIKDREKMQATVEKLLALAPFFKKSEYLGRTVWALDFPGLSAEEGGEGIPAVSLSVMDTHLAVAASKAIVEEVLRRVGKEVKSIKDTPDFKALRGLLPASTTFLCYESPKSYADAVDEMKKTLRELEALGADVPEEGDAPGARKPPEDFDARMDKLFLELIAAVPEGKVFSRHVAGGLLWSFVEDRGIGLAAQVVLRKAER